MSIEEKNSILEFLDHNNFKGIRRSLRSKWFYCEGISAYLRIRNHDVSASIAYKALIIANIKADEPGNGDFKRFMQWLESEAFERDLEVEFENVLNLHLEKMLLKHGYKKIQRCEFEIQRCEFDYRKVSDESAHKEWA